LNNNSVRNIAINSKASSLLFLYTSYLPSNKEEDFVKRINKWRSKFSIRSKRSPIAYFQVKYADGTLEKITMNYGYNVGPLRPPLHSRFTYDIRYVYRAVAPGECFSEARDCRDCSPGSPAAYQYEWVNPYPEKEIKSIDFVSLKTEVIPALIAITAREAK
jgi:hypothetical protein